MIVVALMVALIAIYYWFLNRIQPFNRVVTIAGTGNKIDSGGQLRDPFGLVASGNSIAVTDGMGGRVFLVDLKGKAQVLTEGLNMPSQIAVDRNGDYIVANSGDHTIVRINQKSGKTEIIAGVRGTPGDNDGPASEARFRAPIGVAVDANGNILVADTYNDRIRKISAEGQVTTIAGSVPGNADSPQPRFDTPCGLAISNDGSLWVADTGNRAIRRVLPDGTVSTLALTDEAGSATSAGTPVALFTVSPEEIYYCDFDGSISYLHLSESPAARPPSGKDSKPSAYRPGVVYRVVGRGGSGLVDGDISNARVNHPTGIALMGKNVLAFADGSNGLVRAVIGGSRSIGRISPAEAGLIQPKEIRAAVKPRWPFDPPATKREIAGTLGEIRGQIGEGHDAWFHNGLDVPGGYGEAVHALYPEKVTLPLAVEGTGGLRERIRFPLLGYTHLRLGRDQNDKPIGNLQPLIERDGSGRITRVRVPRGTEIKPGDIIGTLNAFNHVHLIAGPVGFEVNAIAALEFPGLEDKLAPVVELVRVFGDSGEIAMEAGARLSGKIAIAVRAYDQMDGNRQDRRLGVYRAGFQLLTANGTKLKGWEEPLFGINFERLPDDQRVVPLVYAEPSQAGYTGKTIFDYLVTNTVKGGQASEGRLDTKLVSNGSYILRAVVEDYFGNRGTRDYRVEISN